MIYELPKEEDPIKQGDIFYPLPFSMVNLEELSVTKDGVIFEIKKWEDTIDGDNAAIFKFEKVYGIVASQDCDASNSTAVSFFLVLPISKFKDTPPVIKTGKGWIDWVIKKARSNPKWFFLPLESKVGFNEHMYVHLETVFQIERTSLNSMKSVLRKGKLCHVAREHFRETVAQFFRRYAYNEWYTLNKDEFKIYQNTKNSNAKPFPWQE